MSSVSHQLDFSVLYFYGFNIVWLCCSKLLFFTMGRIRYVSIVFISWNCRLGCSYYFMKLPVGLFILSHETAGGVVHIKSEPSGHTLRVSVTSYELGILGPSLIHILPKQNIYWFRDCRIVSLSQYRIRYTTFPYLYLLTLKNSLLPAHHTLFWMFKVSHGGGGINSQHEKYNYAISTDCDDEEDTDARDDAW